MLQKLKEKYYWPGMATDGQNEVKKFDLCRCIATDRPQRSFISKQQVAESPLQSLYIDFMAPYPKTRDGNTCIFLCLDHFSKFAISKPMRKASTAVKCLEQEGLHVPEVTNRHLPRQNHIFFFFILVIARLAQSGGAWNS